NWRRIGAGLDLVSPERAVLKRHKPRSIALKADVRGKLPLEHLTSEQQLVAILAEAYAVAHDGSAHSSGKLWNEVAHLIRVWHQDHARLRRGKELLDRRRE